MSGNRSYYPNQDFMRPPEPPISLEGIRDYIIRDTTFRPNWEQYAYSAFRDRSGLTMDNPNNRGPATFVGRPLDLKASKAFEDVLHAMDAVMISFTGKQASNEVRSCCLVNYMLATMGLLNLSLTGVFSLPLSVHGPSTMLFTGRSATNPRQGLPVVKLEESRREERLDSHFPKFGTEQPGNVKREAADVDRLMQDLLNSNVQNQPPVVKSENLTLSGPSSNEEQNRQMYQMIQARQARQQTPASSSSHSTLVNPQSIDTKPFDLSVSNASLYDTSRFTVPSYPSSSTSTLNTTIGNVKVEEGSGLTTHNTEGSNLSAFIKPENQDVKPRFQ